MTPIEHVILVDENDQPIGVSEKLAAHRNNLRHRAFSIFIVRENPFEILLQQRASHKYHSANLWTNTCCSHPRPNEDIIDSGQRRLKEEMGLNIPLKHIGSFHYIAHFDNGLTENEIDYVLVGQYNGALIVPNPEEVQAYRWITPSDLQHELISHPALFTPWLAKALEIII